MAASKVMKRSNGTQRAPGSAKTANQKHKSANAKAKGVPEPENQSNIKYIAAFGIIIIVLAFAGAIVYGLGNSSAQTPFSTFQNNFNTANAVVYEYARFRCALLYACRCRRIRVVLCRFAQP